MGALLLSIGNEKSKMDHAYFAKQQIAKYLEMQTEDHQVLQQIRDGYRFFEQLRANTTTLEDITERRKASATAHIEALDTLIEMYKKDIVDQPASRPIGSEI